MKTILSNNETTRKHPSSLSLVVNNDTIHLPDLHSGKLMLTGGNGSAEELIDPPKIEPVGQTRNAGATSNNAGYKAPRKPDGLNDGQAGDDEDTLIPITT